VARSYEYKIRLVEVGLQLDGKAPKRVVTTIDALKILKGIYRKLRPDREHFVVLGLDLDKRLLGADVVNGNHNAVHVTPRDLVFAAADMRAHGVILAHNHPTGKLTQTKEDRRLVAFAREFLGKLEIRMHDHIILGAPAGARRSKHRPWSEAETDQFLTLWKARTPVRRMQRLLQRTEDEIKAKAEKHAVLLPGQKRYL
jgi:DNA repair protein RadC